jgi:uncharacterized OB-fold protein
MYLKKKKFKRKIKLTGEIKTYTYYYLAETKRKNKKPTPRAFCYLGKEPKITREKILKKNLDPEKLSKIKGLIIVD